MKKRSLPLLSLVLTAILLFSLSSCSKGADFNSLYSADVEEDGGSAVELQNGSVLMDESKVGSTTTENSEDLTAGRKIIQNLDLSIQTKEFDSLMEKLQKEISDLGGYIEESTTNGREIDSDQNRNARMTVRIPAKNSTAFDSFLSENSVVISRSVSTEDVTLQYVDMESRISALEIEKSALEELLKNAASVEDVISIREKLTDVIYELESYKSKLRTYDNLVDFCTVSLYISEVERTAVVEEQNVWQKIGTNLKNNFASVWDGLVEFFILLVSSIPFLLPLALAILALIIVIRLCKKRKKNSPSPTSQNPPTPEKETKE